MHKVMPIVYVFFLVVQAPLTYAKIPPYKGRGPSNRCEEVLFSGNKETNECFRFSTSW